MRGLLLFLVGCPFVGEGDLEDRLDADGDSFPMGDGVGEDCDDSNPDIHPRAEEICDGLDNDCNPDTVDGGMSYPFYRDADGDGFGDPSAVQTACDVSLVGTGWVEADLAIDCDDGDAGIHPEAAEVCGDGVDQNCDTSHGDCDLAGSFALEGADAILTALATESDDSDERLGMYFGIDLEIAGDVNGDGHLDLLIGALNPMLDKETIEWETEGADASANPGYEPSVAFIVYGPFSDRMVVDDGTHPVAALIGVSVTGWGAAVAAPGDLDGDGLDDVVVGSYGGSFIGQPNLSVFTGAPLGLVFRGDVDGSSAANAGHGLQGFWLSEPGDLDGDGVPDVLSGAPDSSSMDELEVAPIGLNCAVDVDLLDCGAMHLFSGQELLNADGGAAPILTLQGPSPANGFGMVVEPAGDVDGDGTQELLVSAPRTKVGDWRKAGRAWLVPGDLVGFHRAEDVQIARFSGTQNNDGLGRSLHALGDMNQDGYGDFGIGVPGSNLFGSDGELGGVLPTDAGEVLIYVGPVNGEFDGGFADLVVVGESIPGMAGSSLGGGALDGDGAQDLVVGARENSTTGLLAGGVYIYYAPMVGVESGLTLTEADAILHGHNHVDLAGYALATGHDFNGDGGDDLVIGALGANEGGVVGYEGAVHLVWSGAQ